MILQEICPRNLDKIQEFFKGANKFTPADLNSMMLSSWAKSLKLHFTIVKGVLYVFAFFGDKPCLWIPPLGNELKIENIQEAFKFLYAINPNDKTLDILYCWKNYPLFDDLKNNRYIRVIKQGSEYIYSSKKIALLQGREYKTIRSNKNRLIKSYGPKTYEYNHNYSASCLEILEQWRIQKEKLIKKEYLYKFNLEYSACHYALKSKLPLEGVVSFINERPVAFSLGYKHGEEIFNCMFEKTDPFFKDAPSFIFSELGRFCSKTHTYITAGEDWGIAYLAQAKKKWSPNFINETYKVSLEKRFINSLVTPSLDFSLYY